MLDPREFNPDEVLEFDQDAAVIRHGRELLRSGIPRDVVAKICSSAFRRSETDVLWLLAGPVPPAGRVTVT
jgi:hypothetical protein